jgi:hypothetical protein
LRPLELDSLDVAGTAGAARIRRWMAFLMMGYAGILAIRSSLAGEVPSVTSLLIAAFALAVYKNVLARFLRDWTLVFAGLFAYLATGHFQPAFDVGVHYRPQLEVDKLIGFGTVPTIWLQAHLYSGRIGILEISSTLVYVSHFVVPLVLGLYLWFGRRGRAFTELMFGILVMSILADITFVLAPTAPPWLAAEHGYLPPVHHIVNGGLMHLHMDALAAAQGNPSNYNIVAALPSMHVGFPAIALLVLLRHRVPRWVIALQSFQLAAVVFAIVYTGEHYLTDALVGVAYAAFALAIVRRGLERVPKKVRGAKASISVETPVAADSL